MGGTLRYDSIPLDLYLSVFQNNYCRCFKEDSDYARFSGWKELGERWRRRLTDPDYSPRHGQRLPLRLIPKLLLKLYEVFPDYYDPQCGKILRMTLAACRLVCREWSKIVASKRREFSIRVDGKKWPTPSWYILKRAPLQVQDGSRMNQQSDTVWRTQSYREGLIKSHPKFLPELTQNILPGFYRRADYFSILRWKNEDKSVIQSTLAACCLVSRDWNRKIGRAHV